MKRFLIFSILVISTFFNDSKCLEKENLIKNLVFARKIAKGFYAASKEFKPFEQIYLFITWEIRGNGLVEVEWHNPKSEKETETTVDLKTEENPTTLCWLKLGESNSLVHSSQRLENQGIWKAKIFLNRAFVREETFKIE